MNSIRAVARVVVLVGLGGCITDPVTGKSTLGMPTTDAEEQQMGQSYRPMILQQFSGAYPDAALQSHLSGVVLGMARRSVRPDLAWNFTVVNSSEPNAFAVPGGEVFISRGMLARLDNEAQFAVVMGHEIGHVEHRHTVQSQGRDTLLAALGQMGGQAIGSEELGGLVAGLAVAHYSRAQEREADVRGVNNAFHAGYDPRQGAEVFRKLLKMKQDEGGGEGTLDAWTSSHPLDSERIENIEKLSAEIDPRLRGRAPVADLKIQSDQFARVQAGVIDAQRVYDRHDQAMALIQGSQGKDAIRSVIAEFEACARALPGHAFFSNTVGKAYLAAGDAPAARQWFERAAGLGQGLLEPEYGLALVEIDASKWQAAVTHADRGLEILPENYLCLWARGEANWQLGRRAEAEADLQKVMKAAPSDSLQYQSAASRLQGDTKPAPVRGKRKGKKK